MASERQGTTKGKRAKQLRIYIVCGTLSQRQEHSACRILLALLIFLVFSKRADEFEIWRGRDVFASGPRGTTQTAVTEIGRT